MLVESYEGAMAIYHLRLSVVEREGRRGPRLSDDKGRFWREADPRTDRLEGGTCRKLVVELGRRAGANCIDKLT